jgi:circadian clock protein KaiB
MTGVYELTLFVSGASEHSTRAIADARQLCDAHLPGAYRLAIVDLQTDPAAAVRSRVFAAPTLVKNLPLPVRKLVGDLSNTAKVLLALDLPLAKDASSPCA